MLDAYSGWQQAENERSRIMIETVRRATGLLWNMSGKISESRVSDSKLWPLPGDTDTDAGEDEDTTDDFDVPGNIDEIINTLNNIPPI